MTTGLLRISAPHFVCGVVIDEYWQAVRVAPIVNYMRGWTQMQIIMYCNRKRWKVELL